MSRVMASVCGEKSHDGVRMPTGRWPETFSSMSAERICRSRSEISGRIELRSWIQPWMPISWPSATARRCSSG